VNIVAERVRNLCQSLNAKLTLSSVHLEAIEDPQHEIFMEHFAKLQIEDKLIKNVLQPNASSLVGYRALILDKQRIYSQSLRTPNQVHHFAKQVEGASLFINNYKTQIFHRDVQKLHLVPGDSDCPTLTICLTGRVFTSRLDSVEPECLTICGNIQEFYITRKNDLRPSFRLCIQKGPQEFDSSIGRVLNLVCKESSPVVDLIEDAGHIFPDEAIHLWKRRFIALFASPALMNNIR
jgi:hypothetical protein